MNRIVYAFADGGVHDSVAVPVDGSLPSTLAVPSTVFVPRSMNCTCALRMSPGFGSATGSTAVMSLTCTLKVTGPAASDAENGPLYVTRASSFAMLITRVPVDATKFGSDVVANTVC